VDTSEEANLFEEDETWLEDYADPDPSQDDDFQIDEYDLTSTPNDFNILTIVSFIKSGAVKIPGFQRNYVWDINRASKLIESLILGLPVPQIFLYEEARNKFLVIDGQQRLMSIYYFVSQRFPLKEKRGELRIIFERKGQIPDEVLHDDQYFTNFNLSLPQKLHTQPNKFKGLNYSTLGDYKTQFELRPIRNVIVKQNLPKGDDSSIYEIFNRLNSGGMNLGAQEIRASLYYSPFYDMLYRINTIPEWRNLLHRNDPDLHMKDIELLLRGFAMLIKGRDYTPSLTKFLNEFSRSCKKYTAEENEYLEKLFRSFLKACSNLPADAFINPGNRKFNIALFEAVFAAACTENYQNKEELRKYLDFKNIEQLRTSKNFQKASHEGTTKTNNVETRLSIAREIIGSL
jgi:uncharacterized protein with ParB-like and HNH nuclease domain